MANDSLASAREIREPIDHNDNIGNAFDGITYEKGAGVLAMLERYVGEDKFQAGVRLHDGFVRHVFETTRPLPTYLLAFAVGPYDLVDFGTIPPNSVRDRELPLRGIAARGLGDRLQYALKHTDGLLTELEEYFGTPYPYRKLDIIAVPESFGGAMENAGAIVYDEYLLLMDEESPLGQRCDKVIRSRRGIRVSIHM